MAKKKSAGARASRRTSKKKPPVFRTRRSGRSPAVLFDLGRAANSFLYWMTCRFIISTPLTRAREQNAAAEFQIAWHNTWPSSVHLTDIDSIVREAQDRLKALETEQWNVEVRPQLFQGIHGPDLHPDQELSFIEQYRAECESTVRQAQERLFQRIEPQLNTREMIVVKLGRASEQILNPISLELIWQQVSWAFGLQVPLSHFTREESWPSPESSLNRGSLFYCRSAALEDDFNELRAALLAQPRWEESVRYRRDWSDFERDRSGLSTRCFPPDDSQLSQHRFRRQIIIEICQLLRHAAEAWHPSAFECLTPRDPTVQRTTAGRLHDFLIEWTASLGGPIQVLRTLLARLASDNPTYGYLDIWVDVGSETAGRRNLPAFQLSRNPAILLDALVADPEGFASHSTLLDLLSPGIGNMDAVYRAVTDVRPSLRRLSVAPDRALIVRPHTRSEKGYILIEVGR